MLRARKLASPFRYFNSSPEVIRLVVLMYVRFPLSLRNVEDLLFERGIDICHGDRAAVVEQVRAAVRGRHQTAARQSHARAPPLALAPGRDVRQAERRDGLPVAAVDHEDEVLDSYITRSRDKAAALTFMKKALKRHGSPEAITTDGLRSYGAAMDELGNREKQEIGRWANNRVENSHLPFRRRERAMNRFRRMKTLQKFASVHASLSNHFSLERHLVDRKTYKDRRSAALAEWGLLAN